MLADDGGAAEWDENHAQIAESEKAHGEIMAGFVKDERADEEPEKFGVPTQQAGDDEKGEGDAEGPGDFAPGLGAFGGGHHFDEGGRVGIGVGMFGIDAEFGQAPARGFDFGFGAFDEEPAFDEPVPFGDLGLIKEIQSLRGIGEGFDGSCGVGETVVMRGE